MFSLCFFTIVLGLLLKVLTTDMCLCVLNYFDLYNIFVVVVFTSLFHLYYHFCSLYYPSLLLHISLLTCLGVRESAKDSMSDVALQLTPGRLAELPP